MVKTLCFNAGGTDFIPGQGIKILHEAQPRKKKNLQVLNAGESMEKSEPSYMVGRNIKLVQPKWTTVWRFLVLVT